MLSRTHTRLSGWIISHSSAIAGKYLLCDWQWPQVLWGFLLLLFFFSLDLSLVNIFLSLLWSFFLFLFFLIKHHTLIWSYLISNSSIYIPKFDHSSEIQIDLSKGLLDSVMTWKSTQCHDMDQTETNKNLCFSCSFHFPISVV